MAEKARFSIVSDIYDAARGWRWRCLRASLGTTPGLVLMAMLGKAPALGPAFLGTCDILLDGTVTVRYRDGEGGLWNDFPIGSITALRDEIRRLADHVKLDDADREALFVELRKWVRKDHRAKSEI